MSRRSWSGSIHAETALEILADLRAQVVGFRQVVEIGQALVLTHRQKRLLVRQRPDIPRHTNGRENDIW